MMRVIAGKYKGQIISSPPGRDTRPTLARTKEAIFNILEHNVRFNLLGISVLDIFAGTGALGFEALSRGASSVIFVDNEPSNILYIKRNGKNICGNELFQIHPYDATDLGIFFYELDRPSLVFVDPPYGQNLVSPTLKGLINGKWLKEKTLLVIETSKDENFRIPNSYSLHSERYYNQTKISFLTLKG